MDQQVTINEQEFMIANTSKEDLELIFDFFDESARYQEERGYPSWRFYDKAALMRDCDNKLQFKVMSGQDIAMAFSVCYSDEIIWRSMEKGDSIYLHRIVVNPLFKGRRLFGVVLEWATRCAHHRGLSLIRMDTWANNPRIIDYYKSFGFHFVEFYTTPDSPALPSHNRNLGLALLEMKVHADTQSNDS